MPNKSSLPDKAPTSEQEALDIVANLNRLSIPPAKETAEIKNYWVGNIVTWKSLEPNLPCNGPPGPKLFGWPLEMQNQIRIQKKGPAAKIIKLMLARFSPIRIPQVDVFLLNRRMSGRYKVSLDNIGEVILSPGRLLAKLVAKAKSLITGTEEPTTGANLNDSAYLEFSFEVTGWDFIKELWDLMWSGSIEVDAVAQVHLPGYETDQFIVQDFDKSFTVNVVLPVDERNWHAWG